MIAFSDANGIESLRIQLRNMAEKELIQFGKKLLVELEAARGEWRRRHTKRRR